MQIYTLATGVASVVILKTRFTIHNILGSLLVIGGCLLVAVPPVRIASYTSSMR